jgi:hypothetical protein
MTVAELVQLYAPLAGLLVLAFWVGALSERVKNLRKDVDELKKRSDAEVGEGGMLERMIRMEVKLEGANTQLGSLDRHMQGVQRQIANLMKSPGVGE